MKCSERQNAKQLMFSVKVAPSRRNGVASPEVGPSEERVNAALCHCCLMSLPLAS